MADWAGLVFFLPLLPLMGFALLAGLPWALSRGKIGLLGVAPAVTALAVLSPFVAACAGGTCDFTPASRVTLLGIGDLEAEILLALDPLAIAIAPTVAAAAAVVLLYASATIKEEGPDLRRFMALMNLFLAGMLTVVLSRDALPLFLGWELIGLTSFLLIATDTQSARAVAAGRKAFVTTRIADAMLLGGIAILFYNVGSLRIGDMVAELPDGPAMTAAAALVLAGALGKSAQIPFQVWLPDAMEGPTPVSALLHSATMVAAGAFLLARLHPLLAAEPEVALAASAIGATTALYGALCAVAQDDLKRLLAWSTISQVGFMVVALGAGAPGAAMAHFIVHAAFKALLFLAGDVMIRRADHSRRIADLAGSRERCPFAYATFVVGAASLAGLPLVTAGWFSKEAVLSGIAGGAPAAGWLWAAALVAAVFSGAYVFRPVIVAARQPEASRDGDGKRLKAPTMGSVEAAVRSADPRTQHGVPMRVSLSLGLLALVAVAGGIVVDPVISLVGGNGHDAPPLQPWLAASTPAFGFAIAWRIESRPQWLAGPGAEWLREGLGADVLAERTLLRPFRMLERTLSSDPLAKGLVAAATLSAPAVSPTSSARDNALYRRLLGALNAPLRLLFRDPLARLLTGATVGAWRLLVRATAADWAERILLRFGRAVDAFGLASRDLQTGRVRDYVLAALVGLLLLATVTGLVLWF